ncbi:hypothetical protein G6671_02405 [Polynucleobacter paneuropaeus]|nr:hypothetical protein G6671_02405 [Polynucleobacter paneuropaeus]
MKNMTITEGQMKQQNNTQSLRKRQLLANLEIEQKPDTAKIEEVAIMRAIEEQSTKACDALKMELLIWQQFHRQYETVPASILLMYFKYIEEHKLNPLAQEIILTQNPEHSWQIMITVDGWAKYLNGHPQFAGMALSESTECINHIPKWIECSIYRKDRSMPTITREYYLEVKTEHPTWLQMPRRMLRHRALTQCARLAFGIGNPQYNEDSYLNEHPREDIKIANRSKDDLHSETSDDQGLGNKNRNELSPQSRIEVLRSHLI